MSNFEDVIESIKQVVNQRAFYLANRRELKELYNMVGFYRKKESGTRRFKRVYYFRYGQVTVP